MNKLLMALPAALILTLPAHAQNFGDRFRPYVGLSFQQGRYLWRDYNSIHFPTHIDDYETKSSRQRMNGVGFSLGIELGDIPMRAEFEWLVNQDITENDPTFGRMRLESNIIMLNAIYDIRTGTKLTPYLGFGLGTLNMSYDIDATPQTETLPYGTIDIELQRGRTRSDTSLAWQVILGAGIELTPNLTLDVGYRYIDFGRVDTDISLDHITTPTGEEPTHIQAILRNTKRSLDSHSFRIGARWTF